MKAIYTLLEEDIAYNGYLSEEQIKEVDMRMADHENGVGRTYTQSEVDQILDNAVK
ncbi:MAG: hypothetical protein V4592_00445 [Bacteroidota bacterium]